MANRKDILKNKGRISIFDERAAVKKWVEIGVVDSVKVNHAVNNTEVKTPSGITVFKTADPDAQLSFDLYHPGDLSVMELLFRGITTLTPYDGSTAQSNEKCIVSFAAAGDAYPLPGFNGAKTVLSTVSVKSKDGTTTYTVSTDYTLAVDTVTGITHVVQVSGGAIPLDTEVLVTYTYTPLKSKVLKPSFDGNLIDRHIIIDSFPVATDTTKYRRYYLPRATVESDLMHSLLEFGKDNSSPNILPVTMSLAKPDVLSNDPLWYWMDTYNA